MSRMKPRRKPGPRVVEVPLSGAALLAVVAGIGADPRCRDCGGSAELRPGAGSTVDLYIEHLDSCRLLDTESIAGC